MASQTAIRLASQRQPEHKSSRTTVVDFGPSKSPTLCSFSPEEVLSAESLTGTVSFDPALAVCGVPDTACRRTLVGAYTLQNIADLLAAQGLSVRRVKFRSHFRFGNAGTLVSEQIAIFPARIGSKVVCIKAAVLEGRGRDTPLLLSTELLRKLGAVMDMDHDRVYFRHLEETISLWETQRGHYGIPMFQDVDSALHRQGHPHDIAEECLEVGVEAKVKVREYDMDMLEADPERENAAVSNQTLIVSNDSPFSGKHGQSSEDHPSTCGTGVPGCGDGDVQRSVGGGHRRGRDHAGQANGQGRRRDGPGGHGMPRDDTGQVQEQVGSVRHLRERQELHRLGTRPRQGGEHGGWHDEAAHLRRAQRCSQVQPGGPRDRESAGEGEPADSSNKPGDGQQGFKNFSNEKANAAESRQAGRRRDGRGEAECAGRVASSSGFRPDHREVGCDGGHAVAEVDAQKESDLQSNPAGHSQAQHYDQCGDDRQLRPNRKTRRKLMRAWQECCSCEVRSSPWNPEDTTMRSVFQVSLGRADSSVPQGDVAEVFSMPRVVPLAEKKGLQGVRSYDIGSGWDFLRADHRKQCVEEIRQCKPRVLMVSPPCTAYSVWQRLNAARWGEMSQRSKVEAQTLLLFGIQLCELQHSMGNYFIFEHPRNASSWQDPAWRNILMHDQVVDVFCDQCMFGLKDPCNHKRYKRPTCLRTNCPHVQSLLACQCDGKHAHQVIEGQVKVAGKWQDRSKVAQVYPKAMVEKLVCCVRKAVKEKETEVIKNEGVVRQEQVFVRAPETEEVVLMSEQASERETERASERASERGRVSERASEQASERASEHASEQASEDVATSERGEGRTEKCVKEVFASERLQGQSEKEKDLIEGVRRCHVNLGHPSRERFLHMLRSASASDAALKIAKNLQCTVCDAKTGPPSKPVTKARRADSLIPR